MSRCDLAGPFTVKLDVRDRWAGHAAVLNRSASFSEMCMSLRRPTPVGVQRASPSRMPAAANKRIGQLLALYHDHSPRHFDAAVDGPRRESTKGRSKTR